MCWSLRVGFVKGRGNRNTLPLTASLVTFCALRKSPQRSSSSQAPHRSSRRFAAGVVCFAARPLPTRPAALGSCGGPFEGGFAGPRSTATLKPPPLYRHRRHRRLLLQAHHKIPNVVHGVVVPPHPAHAGRGPLIFKMLGQNKFALRQGFAPQNACTAHSAAPLTRGPGARPR